MFLVQGRVIRTDTFDGITISDLSTLQPPYAIMKYSCENASRGFPYLRLTYHSGEASMMHLSVFSMHSSLMIFISSSFLAQFIIPAYGATSANDLIRTCDGSADWITPSWPANIIAYCQGILDEFEDTLPEVHSITGPFYEFLPVGMAQKPFAGEILVPVRTPWKLSNGALFSYPHTTVYLG